MEVAGLAVGTLALVGVFQDCVTLLSQIGTAESMGKDYLLLATRLDFQKTLLLQLANRLNLYDNSNYDTRLNDPFIARLMHSSLACIRQLLQDGFKLQKRYGLRPAGAKEIIESSTAVSNRLSSSLQEQSLDFWNRYSDQVSQPDQSGFSRYIPCSESKSTFSFSDKIKWVIKDKEQFEGLVRDLSNLIMDMDRIVPGIQTHTVLKREIQAMHSVQELSLVMDASVIDNGDLVSVTKETIERRCTQLILNCLWFRLIDERGNNIVEAHSKTLEWAINPPASGAMWDSLDQWLRCGLGIYWIHGKPGSGKSTLMVSHVPSRFASQIHTNHVFNSSEVSLQPSQDNVLITYMGGTQETDRGLVLPVEHRILRAELTGRSRSGVTVPCSNEEPCPDSYSTSPYVARGAKRCFRPEHPITYRNEECVRKTRR